MMNKLISGVTIAASSLLISVSASAHIAGGALTDGSGSAISSSFDQCVTVSSGSHHSACVPAAEVVKPAAPEKVAEKVTLSGDALFDTNSDQLKPEGKATLHEFASRAQLVKLTGVDVVGHADSRGDEAYNMDLSIRRALTVKNYLQSKGIEPGIISASGKGETSPVASNDTAEGRAQNRRVDITVTGTK